MRKIVDTYQIYKVASTLPISIADTKAYLAVTNSNQDSLIEDLIWGGVKAFEKAANVCLSSQTWKAFLDKGYEFIELWKYPITGISAVQYYDDDNAFQTLSTDDYFSNVNTGSIGWDPRPAVIQVTEMPSTYTRDDSFIITFSAGYTTIDFDVKQAILAWIYRMYEQRDNPVTERLTFFDNIVSSNRSYGL
ncbi:MAG: hypothetical protein IZT57_03405 [Chloroflexi bacterium]|nr:hypothetical protein [Chloroflexota bacterium]